MRLTHIAVDNFRSIEHLECDFQEVTTFVGPNGAGKSTILRALDWFFNGQKGSLSQSDCHLGSDEGAPIRVRVDFSDFSDKDRAILGPKYCPPGREVLSLWRTWLAGEEKITGKALAYPPFEVVRSTSGAVSKRAAYNELRSKESDLELPTASSAQAVDAAMDEWELRNPERLSEAEVSDTHLFGFNSQGVLAELFDYVFVSADLRAADETEDTKSSILGRILQRAVDRADLDKAVEDLSVRFQADVTEVSRKNLGSQLAEISAEISQEIESYVLGRRVVLATADLTIRPQPVRIEASVNDGHVATPVRYQGHGFQRTLLLAALVVLSRRGRKSSQGGNMFLALEEPELFQHPTQAKSLASVLRYLAEDPDQNVQVAYATHSPYFVEAKSFDQVRRVTSSRGSRAKCFRSVMSTANLDEVVKRLAGFVDASSVSRRWDQVCLKYLPEALFAASVILVEGDEDAAVLEAAGSVNQLAVSGICVAPVCGKTNMFIPFTILTTLGVPCLMVVDNDSGGDARVLASSGSADKAEAVRRENVRLNRLLCKLAGAPEVDFPVGAVSDRLAFVPDTLETLLASDLPGWDLARKAVISQGRGVEGKNASTYALATRECEDEPVGHLATLFGMVRACAA